MATMAWVGMRWEIEEDVLVNENVIRFPPEKIFSVLTDKYAIFTVVCKLLQFGWPQRRHRRTEDGSHVAGED